MLCKHSLRFALCATASAQRGNLLTFVDRSSAQRKLADLCGSEFSTARKLADLCGSELSAAQRGNLLASVDRNSARRGKSIQVACITATLSGYLPAGCEAYVHGHGTNQRLLQRPAHATRAPSKLPSGIEGNEALVYAHALSLTLSLSLSLSLSLCSLRLFPSLPLPPLPVPTSTVCYYYSLLFLQSTTTTVCYA